MPKDCKNCGCKCHCDGNLHAHHWDGDICTCDNCTCKKKEPKTRLEQMSQLTHDPIVD